VSEARQEKRKLCRKVAGRESERPSIRILARSSLHGDRRQLVRSANSWAWGKLMNPSETVLVVGADNPRWPSAGKDLVWIGPWAGSRVHKANPAPPVKRGTRPHTLARNRCADLCTQRQFAARQTIDCIRGGVRLQAVSWDLHSMKREGLSQQDDGGYYRKRRTKEHETNVSSHRGGGAKGAFSHGSLPTSKME